MLRRTLLFERPSNLPPFDLAPLDVEILRHVKRHRFLRGSRLIRVTGEPDGRVLRRLVLLIEHGYLGRPRAQLRFDAMHWGKDLVYGLAKKGVRQLLSLGEVESHRIHERGGSALP